MTNLGLLMVGMVFILLSAMVFCNALEHLGAKLGIAEGVTGSIFVAVGTALPEAIVPLIAIFDPLVTHNQTSSGTEIGIGAILGPPLMLSTLSIALMAGSVVAKRGWYGQIKPEPSGLSRDLYFFSGGYLLAILLAASHNFCRSRLLDLCVVTLLLLGYFVYLLLTLRASHDLVKDGHVTQAEETLYLAHYLPLPANWLTILAQSGIGFSGLVYFAHIFIRGISGTATMLGVPVFILSLVLIPIATELPEKVNSILWLRRGKDTLALANITGAMVFQGLLLPVLGILLTNWQLSLAKGISCLTTFVAVAWLFWNNSSKRGFQVRHFVINGMLYFVSLILGIVVFK